MFSLDLNGMHSHSDLESSLRTPLVAIITTTYCCLYLYLFIKSIVPRPNPSNPQLAKWVEVQRRQMKLHQQGEHSNMTKERIRLLEREGFVWDVHEYRWQGRFEELSEFYMANGHHRIPTKTKIGSSLAKWGTRQKEQRERMLNGEKTLMTDNRFALLRSINFF